MINEPALRDALAALANQNKSQYIMLSTMLAELTALRETVRGLDPTFSEILEDRRRKAAAENTAIAAAIIQQYDVILQRLKNGEVC